MNFATRLEPMARTLQIRDVPEDVHRALRTRAAAAGMSLSDYLLNALTEVASRPSVSDTLRRARARAGGSPVADVVAAVREGRDQA
jgi:plasmid stability protein